MRVLWGREQCWLRPGRKRTGEGCCLVHGALSGNNGRVDGGAVLSCALLRCRVESKAMSVRARGKAHFFGPWATNERGLIALADFKAQQSDMTIGTTACVCADLKIMPP
jgi:hypothetical protein